MRVLFTGLLAATLVGCTTVPPSHKSTARTPTESKVGAKYSKTIKSKKTKAIAKALYTGSTTPSRAAQPKRADSIPKKAKAAIAALLENPASAQFYNLKRAQRKLLDTTMDSICGYVKAKDGPRRKIRAMPFLYTVDDGEAYLVNGRSQVSASVHGAVCK
jgi:hypothetical protein